MSNFLNSKFFFAIAFMMATGVGGCTKEASDFSNNAADMSGLVINEIVAKDPKGGADWIELYNAGNESVLLSDYYIMDDNGYREKASLPGKTLAPGEFIVILAADDGPEDGSYHVPFKLGADDILTLHKGNLIIDTLDWDDGDAPEGSSYGRFPDGEGDEMTLTPTPGGENE
jgi:hypothetical protein